MSKTPGVKWAVVLFEDGRVGQYPVSADFRRDLFLQGVTAEYAVYDDREEATRALGLLVASREVLSE